MRFYGIQKTVLSALTATTLAIGADALEGQSMEGTGLVPTGLLLRQMDGVKRVLMIGAHPDDEDTSLLTSLARGWGAQTAYLSLTRGDGGQNLIGPELWEGLGVIRTGELEAARAARPRPRIISSVRIYTYMSPPASRYFAASANPLSLAGTLTSRSTG